MSAEEQLARLERQVLGIGRVSRFLDAVDEIRRLLAAEDDRLRARVLALVAPSLGRDLVAAVGAAFHLGVLDATKLIGEGEPKGIPRVPPAELVANARAVERTVAAEVSKARRLARAGGDLGAVTAPILAAANTIKRDVTTLVNGAGNAGTTAVADAADLPTVWIAETNACVQCLAYSGRVAKPGKSFPGGLTYGKPTSSAPVAFPPRHPNCRCTVEPLLAESYAEALRREADRSVLRGFSLESESMATRIDAADRLLKNGVEAPRSVKSYAAAAVRRGEFGTRGRPQPKPKRPKPDTPPNPSGKDFRNMTNAEKLEAAARMYGTGSKEYRAAKRKWG